MPRHRSPSGELSAELTEGSFPPGKDPSVSASPSHLPPGGGASRVTLAAIAGAHGVRGEVRLKLFTDGISGLAEHKMVLVNGTLRRLLHVGGTPKSPTARLEGLSDRSAAESLRGTLIEVERDVLAPLEEGEYYHNDLLGLPCVNKEGAAVGIVSAVEN